MMLSVEPQKICVDFVVCLPVLTWKRALANAYTEFPWHVLWLLATKVRLYRFGQGSAE